MDYFRKFTQLALPFTAVIVAELFYRKPLFEKSLLDIPNMQEKLGLKPIF
jgi:hypothetical protein